MLDLVEETLNPTRTITLNCPILTRTLPVTNPTSCGGDPQLTLDPAQS